MPSRDYIFHVISEYTQDDGEVFSMQFGGGPPKRLGPTSRRRSTPRLTPGDLEDVNKEVQKILAEIARELRQDVVVEKERSNDVCLRLAELGRYIRVRVFSDELLEAIRVSFARYTKVSINVWSGSFVIPWELLYDGDDSKPPNYEDFWGCKYRIARTIRGNWDQDFSDERICANPITRVGLLADENLPHVTNVEVPFFAALEREGRIQLAHFSPDNSNLTAFFRGAFDVVHFACHTGPRLSLIHI